MYPNVPCLNAGTRQKPVYLPPEFCSVAPGQRRLKLDERQTAEMIKTAAQKPQDRAMQIQKNLNAQAKLPNDPTVKAFGMDIDPKLKQASPWCMAQSSASDVRSQDDQCS